MTWREWLADNRRWVAAMLVLLVAVVAVVGVLGAKGLRTNLHRTGTVVDHSDTSTAAYRRPLYVDPSTQTATAAADDARYAEIAAVPQAFWFTDWTTSATIEAKLGAYIGAADAAGRLPVAVLYRIPDRDCGGYATGGAGDAAEYQAWIAGAAAAVRGRPVILLLEPDSVGQLASCGADRVALLRQAVDTLSATGAWLYLDGGHSNWWSPTVMAERLESIGIEKTRGFFTNVANYRSTAAETTYAQKVLSALARRGIEGLHYVIDTGRNGATVPGDAHCNVPQARLGARPRMVFDGKLDGYLWIKAPAESDGRCHGGPTTGFWGALALSLLGQRSDLR
ncbi:glycoside hydrolase family 6 protein [Nocardioides sp.]|uniref:glycoside hydrolase family 6 protein n=1 Tax=Nocardioides sp. TaxID=35761 RepID=UPI00262B300E|nr:glycoside hydrolase family 6 protein [Nocardioides sp.]